jgi:MFS family permease
MKDRIRNYFLGEYRNIHLYYVLSVAMNCWFIASNWIYFWTKYMTYGQLGWIDALGFGFALLLEIPSGAIADIIGKKRTIQIAFLGGGIGTLIIATTNTMPQIFIGWMIAQVAYAFYSGAAEAFAYDSAVDINIADKYDKIVTTGESLGMYAGAIATLIGGFIYELNFRIPHLLWSASFFVGLITSYYLTEPNVDTQKFSFSTYYAQLRDGTKELFIPSIRRYSVFFFILSGIYYMYSWGFIRPAIATSFGLFSKEQAILLPILTFMGASAIRIIPHIRKRVGDYVGLSLLSLLMASSFLLASLPVGLFGIILMFTIAIAGDFSRPWLSIVVNNNIPSKYRATALSAAALITRLPYVLVAITAGKMIEAGKLSQFNIGVGLVILAGLLFSVTLTLFKKANSNSQA